MSPRIVGVIQARMGSTRLPEKVMLEIAGKPMVGHVVQRVRRASCIDAVIVATSTDEADVKIVDYCTTHHIPHIRGEKKDLLARTIRAAREMYADIVVRVTGDCPLMDPQVIDKTVYAFLEHYPAIDFGSNRGSTELRRTYPIGLDVEVMSIEALLRADEEAEQEYQREHVTPFLYEKPGRFRTMSVDSGGAYGHLRWAVDTPEDLTFVRRVYELLADKSNFGWRDVVNLLVEFPELKTINAGVVQKKMSEAEG